MYQVVPDGAVLEQITALPGEALQDVADVIEVLALTPWNGRAQHEANPDGPVRWWPFGPGHVGQVVYLILEERREVHLLLVQWLG